MSAFLEGWFRGTLVGAIGLCLGAFLGLIARAIGVDPLSSAIIAAMGFGIVAVIGYPW